MSKRTDTNRERPGEAPGPLDRALDRDRDDRMDLLEGADESTLRGRASEDEARIPLAEERLAVETRQAQLGEVRLRKAVEAEERTIPVELAREEVRVEQRDVVDRPVQPGDRVFEEGTIRVPVLGEEPVVTKETVVVGEVVMSKARTVERQDITETVRRERVEVDRDYDRHQAGFRQHFDRRRQEHGDRWTGRTWEEAEPTYQYGYLAGRNSQYRGRQFEDVEADLRSDYERRYGRDWGGLEAGATDSAGAQRVTGDRGPLVAAGGGDDRWQHLREEIREGWDRARDR